MQCGAVLMPLDHVGTKRVGIFYEEAQDTKLSWKKRALMGMPSVENIESSKAEAGEQLYSDINEAIKLELPGTWEHPSSSISS